MTDNMDQRLEKVEGTLGTVVILIEGKPVLDIDGTKIGTKGGMVRQLDDILAQLPRRWTVTQSISALMVIVVALGSVSTIVWAL